MLCCLAARAPATDREVRGLTLASTVRETQTPAGSREEVPISVDELEGQVHFFPAISNTQQLKQQFIQNSCARAAK